MRFSVILCLLCVGSFCFAQKAELIGKKGQDFVALAEGDNIAFAKYEVTNRQYQLFLKDIEADPELYARCAVQSENWIRVDDSAGPMARNYATHQAFWQHPVVNVSPEGAAAYCAWLTQKIYKGKGDMYFRLPTAAEHQRLRESLTIEYDANDASAYAVLPFNLKFTESNDLVDGAKYTAPASEMSNIQGSTDGSFVQNDLGVQHLIGNVQELLADGSYTGGGWDSLPSEVTEVHTFDQPDPRVGFRVVLVKRE